MILFCQCANNTLIEHICTQTKANNVENIARTLTVSPDKAAIDWLFVSFCGNFVVVVIIVITARTRFNQQTIESNKSQRKRQQQSEEQCSE